MKAIITFFFTFLICLNIYSQSKSLIGTWILDKIQFANGNNLEINNPNYSTKLIYSIEPNSLQIHDQKFPSTFTTNQIKTQFRAINYVIKDKYLITQDENSDIINFFLKAEDFVNKYPEFSLKKHIRNVDTIYIANDLNDYVFEHDLTFDEFLRQKRSQNNRSSKSFKNLNLKVEFILTKENKIKDIKVLNSIDTIYDNDFITALLKSEKFIKNLSGKDLLITKEENHLKWANDLIDTNEKNLYSLRAKGLQFYNQNKFDKAIENFSQINNLDIKNSRFQTLIKECRLKLAISYLAIGKNEDACKTFNLIGDKTDFEIRNYLIDFCSK